MKISKKTDYAIRCVMYLSGREGRTASINEISRSMCVPKSFLAKILQALSKSGIAESVRGINGGFRLSRNPGDISLLEVIETIQGESAINECALDNKLCRMSGKCTVHPVWVEINHYIKKRLKEEKFAKLVKGV